MSVTARPLATAAAALFPFSRHRGASSRVSQTKMYYAHGAPPIYTGQLGAGRRARERVSKERESAFLICCTGCARIRATQIISLPPRLYMRNTFARSLLLFPTCSFLPGISIVHYLLSCDYNKNFRAWNFRFFKTQHSCVIDDLRNTRCTLHSGGLYWIPEGGKNEKTCRWSNSNIIRARVYIPITFGSSNSSATAVEDFAELKFNGRGRP